MMTCTLSFWYGTSLFRNFAGRGKPCSCSSNFPPSATATAQRMLAPTAAFLAQLLVMRLCKAPASTMSPFASRTSRVRWRIMSSTSCHPVEVMSTLGAASTGAHWKKNDAPAASGRLKRMVAGKAAWMNSPPNSTTLKCSVARPSGRIWMHSAAPRPASAVAGIVKLLNWSLS